MLLTTRCGIVRFSCRWGGFHPVMLTRACQTALRGERPGAVLRCLPEPRLDSSPSTLSACRHQPPAYGWLTLLDASINAGRTGTSPIPGLYRPASPGAAIASAVSWPRGSWPVVSCSFRRTTTAPSRSVSDHPGCRMARILEVHRPRRPTDDRTRGATDTADQILSRSDLAR